MIKTLKPLEIQWFGRIFENANFATVGPAQMWMPIKHHHCRIHGFCLQYGITGDILVAGRNTRVSHDLTVDQTAAMTTQGQECALGSLALRGRFALSGGRNSSRPRKAKSYQYRTSEI